MLERERAVQRLAEAWRVVEEAKAREAAAAKRLAGMAREVSVEIVARDETIRCVTKNCRVVSKPLTIVFA